MMVTADSLLGEIVDVLEEQGVDPETYTLYEYVDLDALTAVVNSADTSLEIRITIEGVELSITQDDIRAVESPQSSSSDRRLV